MSARQVVDFTKKGSKFTFERGHLWTLLAEVSEKKGVARWLEKSLQPFSV